MNNETIGITSEVILARVFNIEIDEKYARRANSTIVENIVNEYGEAIRNSFKNNNLPAPAEHIATRNNPVDFLLDNGEALSCKSNKKELGKVCPSNGQKSLDAWFEVHKDKIVNWGNNNDKTEMARDKKALLFKSLWINHTAELIGYYFNLLFKEPIIHFSNLETAPKIFLFKKIKDVKWNNYDFSFTRKHNWNESTTIKIKIEEKFISLAEIQVHNFRSTTKIRFDMKKLAETFPNNIETLTIV